MKIVLLQPKVQAKLQRTQPRPQAGPKPAVAGQVADVIKLSSGRARLEPLSLAEATALLEQTAQGLSQSEAGDLGRLHRLEIGRAVELLIRS